MDKNLEKVLTNIGKALNNSDILWSVGASLLLNRYGLADNPTDIDITVSVSDINKIDLILSAMGQKQPESTSDIYLTDFFYEYVIDGINVDVMAGLKIRSGSAVFTYKFDEESVPHSFIINNVNIPFSSLEEWSILYKLMPQREAKVKLINSYLDKNGIQYPHLLNRMETQINTLHKSVNI